ncbi:UdgX family uracil-DNA binding protein [Streptomyces xantholiticus]|uniref:UdgX family uracil-DNA binding protein n=1 Tax=Streptomyces xantholiticus TaxID=68285 RepID=UPI00199F944E|nr:UdgX family uracil-DNA binding protein [Streptomyces xantholiticus]GGW39193.1 uracil-DNA glycosylase [Streptomyces xantholiticus]
MTVSGEKEAGQGYDAGPFLPRSGGLPALRSAAAVCEGCPLFRNATQTVFGAGPSSARIVLVGEQPGDQEDRQGEPFVGPAGRLLRDALEEAGIDAKSAYFTNAVKHFKFETAVRGKRRIHKAPSLREMSACRPWLAAELRKIEPDLVMALGATAGKAVLGGSFRVSEQRGLLLPLPAWDELGRTDVSGATGIAEREAAAHGCVIGTIHPSAVLRSDDREAAYRGLVSDLRVAADVLAAA